MRPLLTGERAFTEANVQSPTTVLRATHGPPPLQTVAVDNSFLAFTGRFFFFCTHTHMGRSTAECLLPFATTVLVSFSLFASGSAAMPDNPCTNGWTGPNADNKFDCNNEVLTDFIFRKLALVGVPAVVGLLIFFSLPFVCCFRYCCRCCGSSTPRPGHLCCGGGELDSRPEAELLGEYSRMEIRVAKMVFIPIMAVAGVSVLLSVTGASQLLVTVKDVFEGFDGALAFVQDIVNRIVSILSGGSAAASGSSSPSSVPSEYSQFSNASSTALSELRNAVSNITSNALANRVRDGLSAVGYLTVLPLIVSALGLVCGVLMIRTCFPIVLITACWIFAPIYGIFGTVSLGIYLPVDIVCSEVAAQESKAPGVFQWYVIPQCQKNNPILEFEKKLNSSTADLVSSSCGQIQTICDGNPVYNRLTSPSLTFYCRQLPVAGTTAVNASAACRSMDDIAMIMANGAPKSAGFGNPESCGGSANCTLMQCPTLCTVQADRDVTSGVNRAYDLMTRATNAYNQVLRNYSDCNVLIDKVITFVPLCKSLPSALRLLAAAFILTLVVLVATIVSLFRGQKRFIDFDRYAKGAEAFGKKVVSMNSGVVVGRPRGSSVSGSTEMKSVPANPLTEDLL